MVRTPLACFLKGTNASSVLLNLPGKHAGGVRTDAMSHLIETVSL